MNRLDFPKTVTNLTKLEGELISEPLSGSLYSYITAKGNELSIYYKGQLNQAQVDAISHLINNFVEISIFEIELQTTTKKQIEGYELYRRIISDINTNGGLSGYLDSDMLPAYQQLRPIRDMLKDGFMEFAIRYFYTSPELNAMFTPEKKKLYIQWMGELAIKYGSDPTAVSYLSIVPKDQYPFGRNGAP